MLLLQNSACGGELDVDMNAGGQNSLEPTENIVWEHPKKPPNGEYKVMCNWYSKKSSCASVPYMVIVKIDDTTKEHKGTMQSPGETQVVTTFKHNGGSSEDEKGTRIFKARENFLMILENYIAEEDQCSLITFGTRTHEIWSMQAVGNETKKRELSERARKEIRIAEDAATAFYDALVQCAQNVSAVHDHSPKFVLVLTDGSDTSSVKTKADALAALRGCPNVPHLLIIGIALPPEIKPIMEELCELTESSMFVEADGGAGELDKAFLKVAGIIEQASHVGAGK